MAFQRNLPHVDPGAPQSAFRQAMLRQMSRPAVVTTEGGKPFQLTAWRLVPILMWLTGGRFASLPHSQSASSRLATPATGSATAASSSTSTTASA